MRHQLNPSPCRTRLLKICCNALYAIHLFRCWRCVALRFCRPNVIIWVYLYISGCTYNNNYISGCIYISPVVFIYTRLKFYISPAVLIIISPSVLLYFRLYLYISDCTNNYISGCIYISPAVFIQDRKNI